jgi:hypothetical protein
MSSKTFAVVEAVDNPKGAMLVRYQIVERCEPDPEEKRIAEAQFEEHLEGLDPEIRADFKAQISAAKALTPHRPTSHSVEDKIVICMTPADVVAAIQEAKEAHDEMKKLQKSGVILIGNHGLYR